MFLCLALFRDILCNMYCCMKLLRFNGKLCPGRSLSWKFRFDALFSFPSRICAIWFETVYSRKIISRLLYLCRVKTIRRCNLLDSPSSKDSPSLQDHRRGPLLITKIEYWESFDTYHAYNTTRVKEKSYVLKKRVASFLQYYAKSFSM